MPITVLCTSVGNDGFQAIHRALNLSPDSISIVGVDANPYAYGLYLADHGSVVPMRSEAPALISAVLELCRDHNVQLILPLSTLDQTFFATHRETFEQIGVRVAVSPLRAVQIANNKHLLLQEAQRLGMPVPQFTVVSSVSELEMALDKFQADRYPVVIKKEFSTGAQGVKIVKPHIPAAERLFSRDNIVISLADLRRWLADVEPFPKLQISEFVDMKYSVDIFLVEGQSRCAVVRTELVRLYAMSTVGEVVDEPEIEAVGVAMAEALGFEYTVNVEMGLDRAGQPKLVEINPRFPATIDHTLMAGCNMPLWTVCAALARPYEITQPKIGTRYLRHWTSFAPPGWLSVDRD